MVDEATTEEIRPDFPDHNKLQLVTMNQEEDLRETYDSAEALPPGEVDSDQPMTSEEMESLYDQFEMESWTMNSKMLFLY